jgi:cob(I)alamin adenosyltransferase
MPSIYTKKGDAGDTGLLGEGRFSKSSPRIEVLGTIDEVSAIFGVAMSYIEDTELKGILRLIQKDLYNIMAEVGSTPENSEMFRKISNSRVEWLEKQIEKLIVITGSPTEFIIPGEIRSSAFLSLARTVVRRAERRLVEMQLSTEVKNPSLLSYLNRLSSLCFAMELFENFHHGVNSRSVKDL